RSQAGAADRLPHLRRPALAALRGCDLLAALWAGQRRPCGDACLGEMAGMRVTLEFQCALVELRDAQRLAPAPHRVSADPPVVADGDLALAVHGIDQGVVEDQETLAPTRGSFPTGQGTGASDSPTMTHSPRTAQWTTSP